MASTKRDRQASSLEAFKLALAHAASMLRSCPRAAARQRDNSLQVLADGTQDIAALVGLFATDSVERNSVDYVRGYISVSMATCSLLGILGYVRALVKLAMGSEWCQNSGFPTAPVRAILGVAKVDRLPREEVFTVRYLMRTKVGPNWKISVAKKLEHTEDSFPAARAVATAADGYHYLHERDDGNVHQKTRDCILKAGAALLLSGAATSFPILSIRQAWSWSRIIASFGLFIGLAVSSIMWSYVYIMEQVPISLRYPFETDDPGPPLFESEHLALIQPGVKPSKKAAVAVVQPITGRRETILRAVSMLSAVFITLGYLCQYIEVRKSTTIESGIWLGIQSFLALLRVAIWVWDPPFDDFETMHASTTVAATDLDKFEPMDLAARYFVATSEVARDPLDEIVPQPDAWWFPVDLFKRLESRPFLDWIAQALSIANGTMPDDSPLTIDALLSPETPQWYFPPRIFYHWLQSRSGDTIAASLDGVENYGCGFFAIGSNSGWDGGQLFMVPLYNYPGRWSQDMTRIVTPVELLTPWHKYEGKGGKRVVGKFEHDDPPAAGNQPLPLDVVETCGDMLDAVLESIGRALVPPAAASNASSDALQPVAIKPQDPSLEPKRSTDGHIVIPIGDKVEDGSSSQAPVQT